MTDDDQGGHSPKNEPLRAEVNEDAETRAARRELKQSTLSDSAVQNSAPDASQQSRPETPAAGDLPEPNEDDGQDQVLSPKKKRAHDQLESAKEGGDDDTKSVGSTDSAKDRASRLEPEKKRHRDEEDKSTVAETGPKSETSAFKPDASKSASAFAASSFGKLAGESSPFATFGGGGGSKGSVFGSSSQTSSTFSSALAAPASTASKPAASASAPKLTFGGGSTGLSPFAGLSTGAGSNGLSSGSAFGSALSGAKPLSSFAAPNVKPLQSSKPARPFGAPESDVEEDEDEDDDGGSDDSGSEEAERLASPEKESEDRKRLRLQKVEVDDGEAGEATVVSVRAKMFHHEKEAGWKERGAGMLKINVPRSSIDFDDGGVPIPGTFDASALEADDDDRENGTGGPKICRLLLRQDQTHRVILNTALVPAMKFQEKASLKSVAILFTAFEGAEAKPVSITMRMSAANAKTFMNEIDAIQRELRGN